MTQKIKIKYSHLNQGSLTQCYLVNKDSLVESISKEHIRSCAIPTGYLFCCNDVLISFIVQPNTQINRYFMLTCDNEQFHLLGSFSLTALVKKSVKFIGKMTVSTMERDICPILYFAHQHCQMKRERKL